MRCSTPSLLCTGLLLSAVLAGPSVADVPFALPERSPGSDEERFFHALRVRVLFAEGLFEQGKAEAAERQLTLVGKTLMITKDGYIFNSGNQIGEEKLEPARTPDGFRYGAKRQGHRGKSDTLSTLARFYFAQDQLVEAKRAIRRIPSFFQQLQSAEGLVLSLVRAERLDEAIAYRNLVLAEAAWDPEQLKEERSLRSNRVFQFAKDSALELLEACRNLDRPQEADRIAREMEGWLKVRNERQAPPDIIDYREVAVTLIRHHIETDQAERGRAIAKASIARWREAKLPKDPEYLRASFERNRPEQIAFFELAIEQPPGIDFDVRSRYLTRYPDNLGARFLELEMMEAKDRKGAVAAYEAFGREMVTDEKRCKRYLGEVVEALTRLGGEEEALGLLATLQEDLPQARLKRCPITAFQASFNRIARNLDLSSIKASVNVQEEKQKSPERLRQTGVALARTYARAGEMEAAKRMLDKSFAAADSKDGYAVVSGLIATRHELFDEVRAKEVGRLIELAQIKQRRWGDRRASRLASVARLLLTVERYDWAEALLDRLSPPNPKWPF